MFKLFQGEINPNKHFAFAFWVSLFISASLIIGGFLTPPKGRIDGSVLTAVGIIYLWPALGFGAKALDNGKTATIKHNDTQITIGKKEE